MSRSSGLFLPPSMALLWAMPALQLGLLLFFTLDALLHFWLNHALLVLCFVAGLLGGAVCPWAPLPPPTLMCLLNPPFLMLPPLPLPANLPHAPFSLLLL